MLTTLLITCGHKIEARGGRQAALGWRGASSSEEFYFLPLCLRGLLGWSVPYKYPACGCYTQPAGKGHLSGRLKVGKCSPHSKWSFLPSPWNLVFPSIRVFSKELALHIRWPKYWSLASVPFLRPRPFLGRVVIPQPSSCFSA